MHIPNNIVRGMSTTGNRIEVGGSTSCISNTVVTEIIDGHHHFLDVKNNSFQSFLGSLLLNDNSGFQGQYGVNEYYNDVVTVLKQNLNVNVIASVHVECLPDNNLQEALWIESLIQNNPTTCTVRAIVASCNIGQSYETVASELQQLYTNCPHVKGIRWILDYVGPNETCIGTHVATTRHNIGEEDYLRYYSVVSESNCDNNDNNINNINDNTNKNNNNSKNRNSIILPNFLKSFALLEKYNYTFDLQCAPEQFYSAYTLALQYPNINIVIDHLGKPLLVSSPECNFSRSNTVINSTELQTWRTNLQLLSTLSNVYIKLSMLGWAVPGWIESIRKHQEQQQQQEGIIPLIDYSKIDCPKVRLVQQLVYEAITVFTPSRCMIGLNWWKDSAMSDSDGLSTIGPTPVEYITFIKSTILLYDKVGTYNEHDVHTIFVTTAKTFYKIDV